METNMSKRKFSFSIDAQGDGEAFDVDLGSVEVQDSYEVCVQVNAELPVVEISAMVDLNVAVPSIDGSAAKNESRRTSWPKLYPSKIRGKRKTRGRQLPRAILELPCSCPKVIRRAAVLGGSLEYRWHHPGCLRYLATTAFHRIARYRQVTGGRLWVYQVVPMVKWDAYLEEATRKPPFTVHLTYAVKMHDRNLVGVLTPISAPPHEANRYQEALNGAAAKESGAIGPATMVATEPDKLPAQTHLGLLAWEQPFIDNTNQILKSQACTLEDEALGTLLASAYSGRDQAHTKSGGAGCRVARSGDRPCPARDLSRRFYG